MSKPVKCQLCHQNEAVWAMQYVAQRDPSFYTLGSHIRGFRVTKICDKCRELSPRVPRQQAINLATADVALALEELGIELPLRKVKARLQSG